MSRKPRKFAVGDVVAITINLVRIKATVKAVRSLWITVEREDNGVIFQDFEDHLSLYVTEDFGAQVHAGRQKRQEAAGTRS